MAGQWEDGEVELPEKETILHIRVSPPKTGQVSEIQSITLKGQGSEGKTWVFRAAK